MDALADRSEQDDGSDADGDAEQGQEAAQALGGDGADGELQGVGDQHGVKGQTRRHGGAEKTKG